MKRQLSTTTTRAGLGLRLGGSRPLEKRRASHLGGRPHHGDRLRSGRGRLTDARREGTRRTVRAARFVAALPDRVFRRLAGRAGVLRRSQRRHSAAAALGTRHARRLEQLGCAPVPAQLRKRLPSGRLPQGPPARQLVPHGRQYALRRTRFGVERHERGAAFRVHGSLPGQRAADRHLLDALHRLGLQSAAEDGSRGAIHLRRRLSLRPRTAAEAGRRPMRSTPPTRPSSSG